MSKLEINIEVTVNDILKSISNPKGCPACRAISRKLRETLSDVEIVGDSGYIWDEWDCPSKKFKIDESSVDIISNYKEAVMSPHMDEGKIKPFEFKIEKRK